MEVSVSGRDRAAHVRTMFDRLAPRYDLFNDVLSAGVHRGWRRRAVEALAPLDGRRYLDLCAGTLDLSLAIVRAAPRARVAAADFSFPMLASGLSKLPGAAGVVWPVAADARATPFGDEAFDGVTIGFGLRNLVDLDGGLSEMRRVLAPGGRLVVLEFTTPPGRLFRALYHTYFHHVLPWVGGWIAGDGGTSRYLPDSVARFPEPPELAERMREAGLSRVRYRLLTRGIAAIHVGVKE